MSSAPIPEGPGSVAGAPNLPEGFADTFTSRYIDVGDLRLHAVTGGGGPPLLLVHGWPQTWYAWRLVMPALARDFTVVAPDQRGTGIDANDGFSIGASPQLVRGGFNVIRLNASYHRELSMRNNA